MSFKITALELQHQQGFFKGFVVVFTNRSKFLQNLIPAIDLSRVCFECPKIVLLPFENVLNRLSFDLLKRFLNLRHKLLVLRNAALALPDFFLLPLRTEFVSLDQWPACGLLMDFCLDFQLRILVLEFEDFCL